MIRVILGLALLAVAGLLLAGPGVRLGMWPFPVGFRILTYSAFTGAGVALLAFVALLIPRARRTGTTALATAVVLGSVAFGLPWWQVQQARSLPPIHDITTDTVQPPAFVAVLPLRADARNSADYGGADIAEQQHRAYPDLQPQHLALAPAAAFDAALGSARSMGWDIVASDAAQGRIEATDTTLWFGFKDDVVIRVRADGDGSRVDVRSVSRVGQSDIGTNARRIRAYLSRLREVR